ncbi:MAG: hypothetical protein CME88_16795 [Hirschia sp.]|nr:hypothetical protein [Hirschia sp.]MBF20034.1 hypothetical protein [Hirschia sp.]
MIGDLIYTKKTHTSRQLLDLGMSKFMYSEIKNDRVLRAVWVMEDGRAEKDTIERDSNKALGLDTVSGFEVILPDESSLNARKNIEDLAYVEWSSKEEFEAKWRAAKILE